MTNEFFLNIEQSSLVGVFLRSEFWLKGLHDWLFFVMVEYEGIGILDTNYGCNSKFTGVFGGEE